MTVSKNRALIVAQAPVTVFNAIVSRPTIGGASIQYWDPTTWLINAGFSVSMASWGENISIQVYSGQNNDTVLSIESHSSLPTTLVDFGRNQNNVDAICNEIASMFPGAVFVQNP